MKLSVLASVLACAVASALGQTIELGAPTDGEVLHRGHEFTAQVIRPISMSACVEVGIALSVAHCDKGVCPTPEQGLLNVLYAGPWNPTPHTPGGYYQNFTLQVPSTIHPGPAVFTLTHLCLLGGAYIPLLEYRNATVKIA